MRIAPCGTRVYASDDREDHIIFAEDVGTSISQFYGEYTGGDDSNVKFWAFVSAHIARATTIWMAKHEASHIAFPERNTQCRFTDTTIETKRAYAKKILRATTKAIDHKVDVSKASEHAWQHDMLANQIRARQFRGVMRNYFYVVGGGSVEGTETTRELVVALNEDGRWLRRGGARW